MQDAVENKEKVFRANCLRFFVKVKFLLVSYHYILICVRFVQLSIVDVPNLVSLLQLVL